MEHEEKIPLHVPIGTGSAVWYTWVTWWVEGYEDVCEFVNKSAPNGNSNTGDGKCSLPEAMRSPGDSNATTGTPNVTPSNEASAPPSE